MHFIFQTVVIVFVKYFTGKSVCKLCTYIELNKCIMNSPCKNKQSNMFYFSFEAKYTSPYGDYVESVNGVKESYTVDGYYWEFFVNAIGVSIGM